jgi:hypothetical protein
VVAGKRLQDAQPALERGDVVALARRRTGFFRHAKVRLIIARGLAWSCHGGSVDRGRSLML